jgi:isocitrate/isopropylmalate dehydrogenase
MMTLNLSLAQGPGLFEPIHGSAPDIAGQVDFPTNQVYILLNITCVFTGSPDF